ncbi:MAG: cytidylate kinase-like family protein [Flavobacteriaceae bacterium]|jgi:cytidylate kinase|nr:cytidylate kinase-like family protein [Flavobacteriaceae bacterium]
MNEKYIITIGRQLGSGGRIIGKKLAENLGFSYYDKELINLASKESGLNKEIFEQADETPHFSFFDNFFDVQYARNYLVNNNLFTIQSEIIHSLAEEKSCVFVGRCADYILRDHPNCLNIFITAEKEDRVHRITESEKVSEAKAWAFAEKVDKKRKEYYNFYSNKVWGRSASYHLSINASVLGVEKTARFIEQLAREKFGM